ncbi:MAG: MBL fold metallo-hydrolase [Flavobacteriaceae bacterium]|nr:MBL fold metallo-hydrolase [Flavobacteriaceae bacterium]MDH3795374.1 MBL fold metallo-hydrolase [Flavobacteriaceae bacterium]
MRYFLSAISILLVLGCGQKGAENIHSSPSESLSRADQAVSLLILGVAQDGGRPHIDCKAECCLTQNLPTPSQNVVSLALTDPLQRQYVLFEATPDITAQLRMVTGILPGYSGLPSAVFLTHAHIGHYTGLMYFGKEAKGADAVPVYAMPRMSAFLKNNGPWSQLTSEENISLLPLAADSVVTVRSGARITPFLVPHRDEYSETVGYHIEGPNKKALFIPDINKWDVWDVDITTLINDVDMAFLDGSFYDEIELPGRNMEDIPHPFIVESMALFDVLPAEQRNKIHFIHMNHTNPLLDSTSIQYREVINKGYGIARQGQQFIL